MQTDINFDVLPLSTTKPSIGYEVTLIAFLVVFFVAIMVVIGFKTNNKDIGSSPIISVGPAVLLIGYAVYRFRKLFSGLQSQTRIMSEFASINGWKFSGKCNINFDNNFLIPPVEYLQIDAVRLLYCIDGSVSGYTFSLYLLQGALRTLSYNQFTVGYQTVLRTNAPINTQPQNENQDIQIMQAGGYTFVTLRANAISNIEVKQLFQLANLV